MLKLNKLFFSSDDQDHFSNHIEPSANQKNFLINCKNEIRDHLRRGIQKATIAVLGMENAVSPKFRTQGSWSYKTCVQPPFLPPQEIDWDFGVYLPVKVWEENGPPHRMAKAYFVLVESLLTDLCLVKKWKLVPGKATCIRVQVASWAHIDIPLYAAPEHEFVQIMEKAALTARANSIAHDSARLYESAEFGEIQEQFWEELNHIVLATRTGEWKSSDPEDVARWFNDRVKEHTEQLRRVCCYLKGWRDYQWKDGRGPTSVSIMIAVAQTFEPQRGRDDLALEKAATHLSVAILGELRERGIDDGAEDFNNRLSDEEKKLASQKARELASSLQQARSYASQLKQLAIANLQKQFGERIPNRTDLIDVDSGAEAIRATPAQRVTAPVVLATNAG
jgi:hypothetical protein